ncbi:hypothetical protein G6F68_013769 [Rhizopus microsporus]|nr:hypothetical protein G6F68_013769 [Rhizopus microsporus]
MMNREHTPNKKYLNYLDVLRLRNKQQLNESEKSENYHWKSLPLWTKLRSNNTKIISNATNEKLVNTTMKSGLWQRRSTSLSYQNSNSLRLTPPKSSTHTTKEQRIAAYMGEQQLKSLSCSLPSNQESLQQTKPTNFWMKRWKVPGDLQSTPGSKVNNMMKMRKTTPLERLGYHQVLNTWKPRSQEASEKPLAKSLL